MRSIYFGNERYYLKNDYKEIKINDSLVDALEEIEKEQKRQIREQMKYIDNRLIEIEKNGGTVIKLVSDEFGIELKVVYIDENGEEQKEILLKKEYINNN